MSNAESRAFVPIIGVKLTENNLSLVFPCIIHFSEPSSWDQTWNALIAVLSRERERWGNIVRIIVAQDKAHCSLAVNHSSDDYSRIYLFILNSIPTAWLQLKVCRTGRLIFGYLLNRCLELRHDNSLTLSVTVVATNAHINELCSFPKTKVIQFI